jgi:TrmH family RNA methyltransferase
MMTNAEQKRLKALSARKGREEHRQFIIEGLRAVQEAAHADCTLLLVLHTDDFAAHADGAALLRELRKKAKRIERVTPGQLESYCDTVQSQGIMAVAEDRAIEAEVIIERTPRCGLIVALDAVSDPGNLGGIIRTCDWFGVYGILLGTGCVELLNPKVVRSTMGSVFHVDVARNVDLPTTLGMARSKGFQILVTSTDGQPLTSTTFRDRTIIVLGNEAHGVSAPVKEQATDLVAIPKFGRAESLNVGIACGIVLSHLRMTTGGIP